MERIIVFFAAVAPALLFLAYAVAKTRSNWNSEALSNAFLLGAVGALAILLVEIGLGHLIAHGSLAPLSNAAATAFLVAAVPEETIKFVILVGVAEKHVDVRRGQDIVALAVAVSPGFATLENLFYVATPADWQAIAASRAVTAVPGHGINGLTMGALLTIARLRPGKARFWIASALLLPVILHAAYDFPLLALKVAPAPWVLPLWFFILLFSAVLALTLCNRTLRLAAEADRASGRDVRPLTHAMPLVVGGCAILPMSLPLGVLAVHLEEIQNAWWGAGLSLLPAALGIDLIWAGVRRRRPIDRGQPDGPAYIQSAPPQQ